MQSTYSSKLKQLSLIGVAAAFAVSLLFVVASINATPTGAAPNENKGSKEYSDTTLEMKLKDDSNIELKGNKFVGEGADEINTTLEKYKAHSQRQLFDKSRESLRNEYRELKNAGKSVADLSQYYQVTIAADGDIKAVSEQLKALSSVEDAYPQPLPAAAPVTPDYTGMQQYLGVAPKGVDSNYGATSSWPGARGDKTKVIDLEYGWNQNHEDLSKARLPGALIPNGTPANQYGDDHGTAVIGILSGDVNTFGVSGIVPNAKLNFVNTNTTTGYTPANAVNIASNNMVAGDVMLIEQQTGGPTASTTDYVPLEWIPSVYDAIRSATAKNITVIEAAGNGNQNLNDTALYGSPFPSGKTDSGAILVGAGAVCSSGVPTNSRLSYSTYGTRVNVQGVGECVTTTGYGGLYNGGVNAYYTGTFNGTSSSSAVVAGAASSFTSAYRQLNAVAPTASYVRSSLQTTGTPQSYATGALSGNIGPLPNLKAALPKTDFNNPTTPTSLTATLNTSNKPALQWNASTDNVGVSSYKVYRKNTSTFQQVTFTSYGTSYTDSSAVAGARYEYRVRAVDVSNRLSAYSNIATITSP